MADDNGNMSDPRTVSDLEFIYVAGAVKLGTRPTVARNEFRTGIDAIEREAAARALSEAADAIDSRRNEPGLVHLDVRYAGYYTGIRSGMESDSKALRARAAEIREKGRANE